MIINPENLQKNKPNKKLLLKMQKTDLKEKTIFKVNSSFHDLKVVKSPIGTFIKYLDTYQAGIIDTPYYKGNLPYINYFLIPYLMNKNIKDILLIGFGTGMIINQYKEISQNLKRVDIVDIEENIFDVAKKYFNFKDDEKYNYILQDGIVFLKSAKKKYDLIIVDVANNIGIDDRFIDEQYFSSIKKHLKQGGIFVSNMPCSLDILNDEFSKNLIEKYKEFFSYLNVYNAKMSNKIFYKTFFDIDEDVLDISNMIILASNKEYKLSKDYSKFDKINVDIQKFLEDEVRF